MKNQFRAYTALTQEEFETLWKNAVFIFDTNVLLNLYRYKNETSTNLIGVIRKLNERVWLPWYVTLEFHRNRKKVITDQLKMFSDVENTIKSMSKDLEMKLSNMNLAKKHVSINPEKFIENINSSIKIFIDELIILKELHIDTNSKDSLLEEIYSIFEGKIGNQVENQEELNMLYKTANDRFNNKIPPGYADISKENSSKSCIYHNGIKYNTEYGDFIIWNEILQYSKKNNIKDLIFVTDDNKEDWWLIFDGKIKISPRPELINEIYHISKTERFHMYNSDQFLTYANKYLAADISSEVISEVKSIAQTAINTDRNAQTKSMREAAIIALTDWLSKNFDYSVVDVPGLTKPDLTINAGGQIFGFNIHVIANLKAATNITDKKLDNAHQSYTSFSFFQEIYHVIFTGYGEDLTWISDKKSLYKILGHNYENCIIFQAEYDLSKGVFYNLRYSYGPTMFN